MNKKALIALLVIVVVALGGGLYYRSYSAKNEMPPTLQAVGSYQGLTSSEKKLTGFLKSEKSMTGSDFKQTKKDEDGKYATEKASMKFDDQKEAGLFDVYSETDTNFDEVMANFKAKEEGQGYMIGFYDVAEGKWKTTKQTFYGVDGISVLTDKSALSHMTIPANKPFVFVSEKDAELYGYKDSSVSPTTSYDFCNDGKKGWNSGVVKKDDLYASVSHCIDDVSSVWVKTGNYPLNDKYKKIYTEGGSTDALKAYKMNKFYAVWVKFSDDPNSTSEVKDTNKDNVKLEVTNLQVIGEAVNADATISLDPAKELGFRWLSTYNGSTISQYAKKDRTEPTLSYTWVIAGSDGKAVWSLTQEYGKPTEGVTKNDATCFNQLYDAGGKELTSGKDWTCNDMSVPGGIVFTPDTKYTLNVIAYDGTTKTATASLDFTTEKAGAFAEENKKLTISNVKVAFDGKDLGSGKVAIDDKGSVTKEVEFTWDSLYDSSTIAQYRNKDKTHPALSYTWVIKSDKKTAWGLTQEYGKAGEGVNKDDAGCFNQLYDASGKALTSGKDWTCPYTSIPGGIVFDPDTKYTITVTAFDGKDKVTSSADFLTEKAQAVASKDTLTVTAPASTNIDVSDYGVLTDSAFTLKNTFKAAVKVTSIKFKFVEGSFCTYTGVDITLAIDGDKKKTAIGGCDSDNGYITFTGDFSIPADGSVTAVPAFDISSQAKGHKIQLGLAEIKYDGNGVLTLNPIVNGKVFNVKDF